GRRFLAAVRWWRRQPLATRPDSPFVHANPAYRNVAHELASALENRAGRYLDGAHRAEDRAIDYTVVTVILTVALFLYGISTQIGANLVRVSLIVVGTLVLLGSVA